MKKWYRISCGGHESNEVNVTLGFVLRSIFTIVVWSVGISSFLSCDIVSNDRTNGCFRMSTKLGLSKGSPWRHHRIRCWAWALRSTVHDSVFLNTAFKSSSSIQDHKHRRISSSSRTILSSFKSWGNKFRPVHNSYRITPNDQASSAGVHRSVLSNFLSSLSSHVDAVFHLATSGAQYLCCYCSS